MYQVLRYRQEREVFEKHGGDFFCSAYGRTFFVNRAEACAQSTTLVGSRFWMKSGFIGMDFGIRALVPPPLLANAPAAF